MIERIGPYEVVRELGRGGMGVVYEARDPALGRSVAIKLLAPGLGDLDAITRFRREAQALAAISHPGVGRVHAVHELAPGRPYLVMDLVPGRPLAGTIEPHRAARLVRDVADAVAALHRAGVLHRDIKPSNVLVSDDDRPVLIDLGLARRLDSSRLTETGVVLGTPGSLAPEQAEGRTDVDTRVDVYGLGALLFHLLAGNAPFSGMPLPQTLFAVLSKEPAWPAAPDGLLRILRRSMAKSREARQPSAEALRDELDAWLAGRAPTATSRTGRTIGAGALVAIAAIALVAVVCPDAPRPPKPAAEPPSAATPPPPPSPVATPRGPLADALDEVKGGIGLERRRREPLVRLGPGRSQATAVSPAFALFLPAPPGAPRLLVVRPTDAAQRVSEVLLWEPPGQPSLRYVDGGLRVGVAALDSVARAYLSTGDDVFELKVIDGSPPAFAVTSVHEVPPGDVPDEEVLALAHDAERALLAVGRIGSADVVPLGAPDRATRLPIPARDARGVAFVAPDRLVVGCDNQDQTATATLACWRILPGEAPDRYHIVADLTAPKVADSFTGLAATPSLGLFAAVEGPFLLRLAIGADGAWADPRASVLESPADARGLLAVASTGLVYWITQQERERQAWLNVRDGETFAEVRRARLPAAAMPRALQAAVSRDGELLAVAYDDGSVELWATGDAPRAR